MSIKITLEVPEDERLVPMIRQVSRTLLEHRNAAPTDIEDIEVVLGELCSNVLRHARSQVGGYQVTLEHDGEHVVVTVTDHGAGLKRETVRPVGEAREEEDGSERFGGFGLQIVESLTDRVEYGLSDPQGTTVRAEKRLASKPKSG